MKTIKDWEISLVSKLKISLNCHGSSSFTGLLSCCNFLVEMLSLSPAIFLCLFSSLSSIIGIFILNFHLTVLYWAIADTTKNVFPPKQGKKPEYSKQSNNAWYSPGLQKCPWKFAYWKILKVLLYGVENRMSVLFQNALLYPVMKIK